MEKIKKLLICIVAVILAGYFVISMLTSDLKHIEDTNGADNYNLQQITDYNIINMDIGALNLAESNELFNNLPTYKSDKFTGVAEVYLNNIYGNRFDITIYNLFNCFSF